MDSHFIEFSGVTCPNRCWMIGADPLVKRFWSVATPTNNFPLAWNFSCKLVDPAAFPVVVREMVVVERVVGLAVVVVVVMTTGVVVVVVVGMTTGVVLEVVGMTTRVVLEVVVRIAVVVCCVG